MRRVCKQCRVQYEPKGREEEILQKAIGWSGPILKHNPKGCPKCNGSGYKGRVGIHELMVTNDELVEGINKKLDTAELKKIAVRQGMKTLHQDSLMKVKEGLSSMEEAISTVPPDMEDLEAIREEFAIDAETKSQAETARKDKLEEFKRHRAQAAAHRAAEESASAEVVSNEATP
jgi:hypothetical protein